METTANNTFPRRVFRIGATIDDKKIVIFNLRSISIAEENRYTNRFVEIASNLSEERKAQEEYDIFVDALASWSTENPAIKENDEETVLSGETPAAAVHEYFATMTDDNARIAQHVIANFRGKLQPKVIFY